MQQAPASRHNSPREARKRTGDASQVIGTRDGAVLPDGYEYTIRKVARQMPAAPEASRIPVPSFDACTPPRAPVCRTDGPAEPPGRSESARRNAARSSNKLAHAAFARELKDSLAEGRPPAVSVGGEDSHMKARWHAAAKEMAYNLLDLRKEGWKGYSDFDKAKLHKELNA